MDRLEFYSELDRYLRDSLSDCSTRIGSESEVTLKNINSESGVMTTCDEFLMLTISSMCFRVVLQLYFTRNEMVEGFVVEKLGITKEALTDVAFYDAVSEHGNLFTGEFKRKLGGIFPCLGMSTPVRLSRECNQFFELSNNDHISFVDLKVNGTTLFEAIMLVEVSKAIDGQLEEKNAVADEDLADSGELELF
ncbi:hypothetical protein [Marinibactrum halimedae]|uniref:Uncharacterized protein n=1 Tax=Marinibactrum halimedae TaxID=1444977 RepID=A0AA37WPT1_9GAMM|nr:hypothetical protein [Marinibactrum halimedae]MCD9459219.1 hypothetical protein [Marinibactrum halimedae]GLS27291.1 hypothetical protein GCM10007877_30100 [Marinibactrum halimedae]